jgi:hypothetical protein
MIARMFDVSLGCRFQRSSREISVFWQTRVDVRELWVDLEAARGTFPSRRNVLKYDITQAAQLLAGDSTQLLKDTEELRNLKDMAQVRS